jgi:hypothetical protein
MQKTNKVAIIANLNACLYKKNNSNWLKNEIKYYAAYMVKIYDLR